MCVKHICIIYNSRTVGDQEGFADFSQEQNAFFSTPKYLPDMFLRILSVSKESFPQQFVLRILSINSSLHLKMFQLSVLCEHKVIGISVLGEWGR